MWPTVIVAAILGAVLLAILGKAIADKKKGKHSCTCGGSCGACPMGGACHSENKAADE